jgi:hypothetical protein
MTEDFRPVDTTEELPVTAPEPLSKERTRSVRRPAAGSGRDRPRAKPRPRPKPKSPAPTTDTTAADAIRGILQLPAAGLIITGQRLESVPLVADGATILVHGPHVATAIAEIAENDPRMMALLEKLLAFGPYGVLLAALYPMIAQFMRNHREDFGPLLEGFGAVQAERIIEAASLEVPTAVTPSPNGQGNTGDGNQAA